MRCHQDLYLAHGSYWQSGHIQEGYRNTSSDLKQTFGVRCDGTLVSAENNLGFGAETAADC